MWRRRVDSSSIASVGFERATNTMELEFRNGGVYRYFGVPQRVFDELMAAPSMGAYFQQRIRNQFPTEREG